MSFWQKGAKKLFPTALPIHSVDTVHEARAILTQHGVVETTWLPGFGGSLEALYDLGAKLRHDP